MTNSQFAVPRSPPFMPVSRRWLTLPRDLDAAHLHDGRGRGNGSRGPERPRPEQRLRRGRRKEAGEREARRRRARGVGGGGEARGGGRGHGAGASAEEAGGGASDKRAHGCGGVGGLVGEWNRESERRAMRWDDGGGERGVKRRNLV